MGSNPGYLLQYFLLYSIMYSPVHSSGCFVIQSLFQEWRKEETELPSPLKNDTPSWARSPKILIDANANQHESLNRFETSCSPTSMLEQEKSTKTVRLIFSTCYACSYVSVE